MPEVRSFMFSAAFLAISAAFVHAGDMNSVRGEVSCTNCSSYSDLTVELQDTASRTTYGNYVIGTSGRFEMSGIPSGSYVLTVRNANRIVTTQMINVSGQSGVLGIELPPGSVREARSAPAGDTLVSVHKLTHKVPKPARKLYDKALSAGDNHAAVISYLEQAVEIDPEYVEALNNLGSRYIQTNQPDKAVSVLERAVAADPSSAFVQTNLAVALLATNKYEDAEHNARHALQLSGDPKAQYILGLSLFMQKKYNEETIQLLRRSTDRFPNSSLALAVMSATRGDRNEARRLVQQYLASGSAERRSQAERMLAALR